MEWLISIGIVLGVLVLLLIYGDCIFNYRDYLNRKFIIASLVNKSVLINEKIRASKTETIFNISIHNNKYMLYNFKPNKYICKTGHNFEGGKTLLFGVSCMSLIGLKQSQLITKLIENY